MKKKLLKKLMVLALSAVTAFSAVPAATVTAAGNPYPTTQDVDRDGLYEIPCTRFAWQCVYDRQGIALPSWGNAVSWWQNAINQGYAVGNEPVPGSIAVWSGDYYGHVAYVTANLGNNRFTVDEGGRTDKDQTSSHEMRFVKDVFSLEIQLFFRIILQRQQTQYLSFYPNSAILQVVMIFLEWRHRNESKL